MAAHQLEPVLLQVVSGRTGTTAAMQLLATSPDIAFDRVPPYENRYLTYLLRLCAPIGSLEAPAADERARHVDAPSGGPLPFSPTVGRAVIRDGVLAGAWVGLSTALAVELPTARYYAEKSLGDITLVTTICTPVRVIQLVRDPRDVFSSILAFDEKRGFSGFGRLPGQSTDDFLTQWISQVRSRSAILAAQRMDPDYDVAVVEYADLVTDRGAVSGRLGEWLGASFDLPSLSETESTLQDHMTADGPESSVGRHRDLPRRLRRRIERELPDPTVAAPEDLR